MKQIQMNKTTSNKHISKILLRLDKITLNKTYVSMAIVHWLQSRSKVFGGPCPKFYVGPQGEISN